METLREVIDPNFLLRNSVYTSLLIGLACPLVGSFLVLRRLIFMGVALPQTSSCGIAAVFALHTWGIIPHMEESESTEHGLAFAGATLFTLAALAVLTIIQRRGRGMAEARLGTVYVLSGAWSILLLVKNPYGEHGLLDRMKGEIIAVTNHDLILTSVTFAMVVLCLLLFKKEFLLVSFDPDMARTLNKNVLFWDGFLFLVIGLAISMAVLSVGPLVTFGFLIIPPLIAHLMARDMRQFAWMSPVVGVVVAFVGFCIAYRWNLPVGPTDVALLGFVYGGAFLTKKVARVRTIAGQY
jgi:ABC-type Mn2+/Zn2+ transport system permease subunit